MHLGQMSDFVSFQLFGFTLVIKLRNFDFESHSNSLRFEHVPRENVRFCFISIAWVYFSHKTQIFQF